MVLGGGKGVKKTYSFLFDGVESTTVEPGGARPHRYVYQPDNLDIISIFFVCETHYKTSPESP